MRSTFLPLVAILCCAILPGVKTQAQIAIGNEMDAKFLTKVKDRTVIVEVKEEDPKVVAKLSKKDKNADRLQHYRDFISNSNDMLKKAVDKYWKFNANIEYKTTTELKDIRGKSKDNVYYQIISVTTIQDDGQDFFSDLSIPVVCYDNSGITSNYEHDFSMYLPVALIPEKESNPCMWSYVQADFDFAIIEMQANFNYTIANNKKIKFEDYGKLMGKQNCGKAKNSTLVIDLAQLGEKVTESDIKSEYKGPIELTDGQTYNNAFDNQEAGKEVIFSFAYGIAKGSFGSSTLFFSKAVVNCATGEIEYYYKPPMFGVMWIMWDIRKQIFDYIEKCN
jgi:hypothetical protein